MIFFGFGFFILVVSSSYTANLATFLTMNALNEYITDPDELLEPNVKICVQDAIVPYMNARFKDIEKNFARVVPAADLEYIRSGIGYLKSGVCNVLIADELDFKFIDDVEASEFICESGIVSKRTEIFRLEWSTPVRTENFQSLNYAMFDRGYKEVEFSEILNSYARSLDCEIYLESGSRENSEIGVIEMALPCTVLLVCMFIGILAKTASVKRQKRNKSDNDGKYLDNDMDALDMMEYKYRLELITLNTQRLSKDIEKYMNQRENEPKFD